MCGKSRLQHIMVGFIKRYWLIILLAITASFLAFLWFAGKSEPIKIVPELEKPMLPGAAFREGARISLRTSPPAGQTGPLYSFEETTVFSEERARQIAKSLGFEAEPYVAEDISFGKTYSWSKEDSFITIVPSQKTFDYGKDMLSFPPPQQGALPSPEQAYLNTIAFLRAAGLSAGAGGFSSQKIGYLSARGAEVAVVTQLNADLIEISLVASVGETQIYKESQELVAVTAWLDKNGEVVKLIWKDPITSLSEGKSYPLKNANEMAGALMGEGSVVAFEGGLQSLALSQDISSTTLTETKLVFLVQEGETLHPVFLLSGSGITWGGQIITVQVFLPAIKNPYYKD